MRYIFYISREFSRPEQPRFIISRLFDYNSNDNPPIVNRMEIYETRLGITEQSSQADGGGGEGGGRGTVPACNS